MPATLGDCRPAARARAALCVAAGLAGLAVAAGQAPPPRSACLAPRRAAGAPGELVAVRCDGRGPPLAGAAALIFGGRLDVNRAPAADLEALPGIGPGRARALVAERARRPFCAAGELARVRGIGRVTVGRLRELVAAECAGPGAPRRLGMPGAEPSPSRP